MARHYAGAQGIYLAFTWANYYPEGGFNDCLGSFMTIDDAKEAIKDEDWYEHYQIISIPLMAIVVQGRCDEL